MFAKLFRSAVAAMVLSRRLRDYGTFQNAISISVKRQNGKMAAFHYGKVY